MDWICTSRIFVPGYRHYRTVECTENSQPCLEIVYEIDLTEVKSFLTHAIDIGKVKVNMLTNSTGRIVADIVNDLKVMADKIYVDWYFSISFK